MSRTRLTAMPTVAASLYAGIRIDSFNLFVPTPQLWPAWVFGSVICGSGQKPVNRPYYPWLRQLLMGPLPGICPGRTAAMRQPGHPGEHGTFRGTVAAAPRGAPGRVDS